jgi:O-antigen ligase
MGRTTRASRSETQAARAGLTFEQVQLTSDEAGRGGISAAKVNDLTAALLAALLICAPVAYGANRPLAWLVFAIAVALLLLMHTLAMAVADPGRPSRLRPHRAVVLAGSGVVLFACFQLLPLGGWEISGVPHSLLPERLTVSATGTLLGVLRLMSYGLLFVLALEVCSSSRRAGRFLNWLFLGIGLHAAWSLAALTFLGDTILLGQKTAYQGVATGTFINRNSFAGFLTMGLMLGLGRLFFLAVRQASESSGPRWAAMLLSPAILCDAALNSVILAALLATGSRLGIVSALAGGSFLLVIILNKTCRMPYVRVVAVLTLLVSAAFTGLLLSGALVLERAVFSGQSLCVRLELYRQTLAMIAERPLLGYGLDGFAIAFEMFHQTGLDTRFVWDRPHNTVLTLWSELGVIAGSIPVLLTIWCFGKMIARIPRKETAFVAPAAAAAVVVACSVHSMGDFSLEIAANTYLFIAIAAAGISRQG